MIWFSAISRQKNILYLFDAYIRMYRASVLSAIKTTPGIKPYLLYDGDEDINEIHELKNIGVTVIQHVFSLCDELIGRYNGDFIAVARGTFLRVDIPRICKENGITDEFILYTDNDVIFVNDITPITEYKPQYLMCAGESLKDPTNYTEINAGVLWMNLSNMTKTYENFLDFIRNNIHSFSVVDQSAYIGFYNSNIEFLPCFYNYKAYWEPNDMVKIIHFHGPKPMNCGGWPLYPTETWKAPIPSFYTKYFYDWVEEFNKIENV